MCNLNRCLYQDGSAPVLTRWSSINLQIVYIQFFRAEYSQISMSHPCAPCGLSFFTASLFHKAQKAHMMINEYGKLEFFSIFFCKKREPGRKVGKNIT